VQAVQRGSLLNLEMITLVFKERYIRWNVIHHPESQNSIAALLSFNRYGKRIIKQIKACVSSLKTIFGCGFVDVGQMDKNMIL